MKHIKILSKKTILPIIILITLGAWAQTKTIKTVDGKTISVLKLDKEIKKAIKTTNMQGISIAIINKNEMVYHKVFGVANSVTKEPITNQSIFEGASLSKPIFAYFVMKMVENGTLELDKPLYKYLPHPGIAPESEEDYKLITARMVLAHQTGFPNHANNKPITLAFKPGTDFMYSGEAYQYLAAIIGIKMGVGIKEGLNQLFQKEVTQPLQMEHTTFVWDDYLEKHKVWGHDNEGHPTQNRPGEGRWNGKTFNAFSSVHSEAADYVKFIMAMLKREGLENTTFDDMLKEQTHFKDDNQIKKETGQTGWGLGFAQKPTPNGMMHLHTGNNHDFQAYAMLVPKQEYGLVVFTNSDKMLPFLKELSKTLGNQF